MNTRIFCIVILLCISAVSVQAICTDSPGKFFDVVNGDLIAIDVGNVNTLSACQSFCDVRNAPLCSFHDAPSQDRRICAAFASGDVVPATGDDYVFACVCDVCTAGTERCTDTGVEQCVNTGVCTNWAFSETCAPANECNTVSCQSNGVSASCVQQPIADGSVCSVGVCDGGLCSCQTCTPGAQRCTNNAVEVCVNSILCSDWQVQESCSAANECSQGVCSQFGNTASCNQEPLETGTTCSVGSCMESACVECINNDQCQSDESCFENMCMSGVDAIISFSSSSILRGESVTISWQGINALFCNGFGIDTGFDPDDSATFAASTSGSVQVQPQVTSTFTLDCTNAFSSDQDQQVLTVCSAQTGQACTSDPNTCSQTADGTVQCDGSCSASIPADPSGLGDACTSAPNCQGDTTVGTLICSNQGTVCSASAPVDPAFDCPLAGELSCGVQGVSLSGCHVCDFGALCPGDLVCSAASSAGSCIDGTVPVTSFIPFMQGWQGSPFNITLFATDNSGTSPSTFFSIDNGSVQQGLFVEIITTGNHSVTFYSVDAQGNQEENKTVFAALDLLAPLSTDNIPAEYTNQSFTFTISPTDPHSGVAYTELQVAPGALLNATSFLINQEGNFSVRYRSVDTVGNAEDFVQTFVALDTLAPVTSVETPSGAQSNNFSVNFTATDGIGNVSGVLGTFVSLDGGLFTQTNQVNITTNGVHDITYFSTDRAGNSEAVQSVRVLLENGAPMVDITSTPRALITPLDTVTLQIRVREVTAIDTVTAGNTSFFSVMNVTPFVNAEQNFTLVTNLSALGCAMLPCTVTVRVNDTLGFVNSTTYVLEQATLIRAQIYGTSYPTGILTDLLALGITASTTLINDSIIQGTPVSVITNTTLRFAQFTNVSTISNCRAFGTSGAPVLLENTACITQFISSTVRNSSVDAPVDNSVVVDSTLSNVSQFTQNQVFNTVLQDSQFTQSNATNSTIVQSTVMRSVLLTCDLLRSIVVDSFGQNCKIINSTITNSTLINSTVINSTVINSTLLNVTLINGTIINNVLENGTITLPNGTTINITNSTNITSLVNFPPVIQSVTIPTLGTAGEALAFVVTASDPNADVLTFNWSFGDGTTSTAQNPSKTFSAAGTYVVRLLVSDGTLVAAVQGNITIAPAVTVTSRSGGGGGGGGGAYRAPTTIQNTSGASSAQANGTNANVDNTPEDSASEPVFIPARNIDAGNSPFGTWFERIPFSPFGRIVLGRFGPSPQTELEGNASAIDSTNSITGRVVGAMSSPISALGLFVFIVLLFALYMWRVKND